MRQEKVSLEGSTGKKLQVQAELSGADERLKILVNSNYILVSQVIRGTLKEGSVCPVCGSEVHGICAVGEEINSCATPTGTAKTENLKNEILDLTEKIDGLRENLHSIEIEISNGKNKIESLEKNLGENSAEFLTAKDKINSLILPWCLEIKETDGSQELEGLLQGLEEKSRNFKEKKKWKLCR